MYGLFPSRENESGNIFNEPKTKTKKKDFKSAKSIARKISAAKGCTVAECRKARFKGGYCAMHYNQTEGGHPSAKANIFSKKKMMEILDPNGGKKMKKFTVYGSI